MKKTILISLSLAIILCLASCGSTSYKNDVATADIASAIDEKITNANVLVLADELYFSLYNPEYSALVSEYTVKYSSSGALYDEYGIFKVEDADNIDAVVTMVEEFIQYKIDVDTGYFPNELPKIKDAKPKVAGNYVMYAFLSDSDADAAFSAFEEALK